MVTTKRKVVLSLTLVVAACLLVSCSNDDRTEAHTDSGDTARDVLPDVTPGTGRTPCEDAPTARLSAIGNGRQDYPPPEQTMSIQASPLANIPLNSKGSLTGENESIERWKWAIEQRPDFALATFGYRRLRRSYERPIWFRTNEKNPLLQVGLAGDYTVSLTVWDDQGVISCNSAELTVQVRPESELYVEFKYPYERVESDEFPSQYFYQHRRNTPRLEFALKRTSDAQWNDDLNDVIPNARTKTDVQDWGMTGDDADDPRWTDISREGPSNAFVQLDGVESDTPYFGAVSMSGTPPETTPAIFSVYVDGEKQMQSRRTLGDNHEAPFGMEVLNIQHSDNQFTIQPTATLWFNN